MADRPGGSSSERMRDYFKYISTVDAAALVGALALGNEFGIQSVVGFALVLFGFSAYLCVVAMFVLARAPQYTEGELIDWLLILTFSSTTAAIVLLLATGVFGG